MNEKRVKQGYFQLIKTMTSISCFQIPKAFLFMLVCAACAGFMQGATVWFKQQLFDKAEDLVNGGIIKQVCLAGIMLGICLIVQLIINMINSLAEQSFVFKLEQAGGGLLNQKAATIDPICYENNRFLDHIEKAGKGLEASVEVFTLSFGMILTIFSYFGFMGVYMLSIELGLLIMLFISFLPYILGAVVRYRVHKNLENCAAPYRRKGDFYVKCITDREYVKETRLLGGYGYFYCKLMESLDMVKKLSWKTTKKSEYVNIGLRFLSMAGYIGMMILLFYYLMSGRVGVGAFAAIVSSLDNMSDTLERIFNFKMNNIMSSLGTAENYLAFLDLPERESGTSFPEGKCVEFRDVTFAYPDANKNSIDHLSLKIKEKETIAIVGSNGAGKSTFARLLLGIYRPAKGSVLIDGIDTRELNPNKSTGHFSAVFQKFQKYKMKVRENVMLSDSLSFVDEQRVKESLQKAELDWRGRSFENELDTMLSREFGGTDLSGGQWQRLAIARGLYRIHNLIILDEPTAAIDPLEETIVYQKFMELSKNKTAVIITHRLGSAKIADRIVVLDKGRIAEEGKHEELIEKKSLYYEMYQAQAKWYV